MNSNSVIIFLTNINHERHEHFGKHSNTDNVKTQTVQTTKQFAPIFTETISSCYDNTVARLITVVELLEAYQNKRIDRTGNDILMPDKMAGKHITSNIASGRNQ